MNLTAVRIFVLSVVMLPVGALVWIAHSLFSYKNQEPWHQAPSPSFATHGWLYLAAGVCAVSGVAVILTWRHLTTGYLHSVKVNFTLLQLLLAVLYCGLVLFLLFQTLHLRPVNVPIGK